MYEVIKKDFNSSHGNKSSNPLPDKCITDDTGKKREDDFAQSANNAYLSGLTARHSIAKSHQVIEIPNSPLVKVFDPRHKPYVEILPLTLEEAKDFIKFVLTHWLNQR